MTLVLTLICLLGYAGLLHRIAGLRPGASLLVTISALLLAQFGLALVGGLGVGTTALRIGGVVAAAIALPMVWRSRADLDRWLEWAPAIVFVFLTGVHWAIFADTALLNWDEFGHWGIVIKEVLAFDALPGADSSLGLGHYPPGTALWIHFVLYGGAHSDGAAYTAQFLLLLAPACCLFDALGRKNFWWVLGTPILLVMLLANLGHGVSNLMVDHVLGMILGGAILGMLGVEGPVRRYAWFILPLAVLPLVKEIGVFLAIVGASCGGAVLLLRTADPRSSSWRAARVPALAVLAALLLAPLVSVFVWDYHVEANELRSRTSATAQDLTGGLRALFWDAEGHQAHVLERFGASLLHHPIEKSAASRPYNEYSWQVRDAYAGRRWIPLGGAISFFAVLMAGRAWLSRGRERRLYLVLGGLLLLMSALYAVQLGLLYLTVFGGSHAAGIPSFVRYVHVLLLPILLVGFGVYWPAASLDRGNEIPRAVAVAVALSAWVLASPPYLQPLVNPNDPSQSYRRLSIHAESVRTVALPGESMFVVSSMQGSGMAAKIVGYVLSPVHATVSAPDVGRGGGEPLYGQLLGFDYVWLMTFDHGFRARYPELLKDAELADTRLFRVREAQTAGGATTIDLEPVPGHPGSFHSDLHLRRIRRPANRTTQ